jgi:hypothetical protein
MLKNAILLDGITLGLVLSFLLVAILCLITHPTATRIRAGRFFTLLGIYGSIIFACFLAIQGFLIMGHHLGWVRIPAEVQNNLAINSAVWIAGSTLMWLLGVSVGRSPWFGAIAGLLAAGALETGVIWALCKTGPMLLARHDIGGYSLLGVLIFLAVLLAAPLALLLRALFERTRPAPEPVEPKSESFVFDM